MGQPPVVEDPKLQTLFDYWISKIEDVAPPRREDIDALDIPKLLPYIWIQEHIPGTMDFRCRLAGEEVKKRYPTNIVGRTFREIIGDDAWGLVVEQYMLAIDTPGVCHSIGPVYMHTMQLSGIGERILMPLRGSDDAVGFIIGATIYTPLTAVNLDRVPEEARKSFTPIEMLVTGPES